MAAISRSSGMVSMSCMAVSQEMRTPVKTTMSPTRKPPMWSAARKRAGSRRVTPTAMSATMAERMSTLSFQASATSAALLIFLP